MKIPCPLGTTASSKAESCSEQNRFVCFVKEASVRLAYPLTSPLPRGEGIGLPNPNIFRFTCHPIPNPALFDFLHPLIFRNLIPSPRGRGLGRGQRTARFVRYSNPLITHNNESPETPLPPRLLQKPNRVRTAAWAG